MLVIKLGGSADNDATPLITDIARHWQQQPWFLVHGGSARVDELSTALGHPPRFVTSPSGFRSRRTDRRTARIFTMACAGDVNKGLVEQLQASGVDALGLSGLDGRLLVARRKKALRVVENGRTQMLRDDYSGRVEQVNGSLLHLLQQQGHLPVISPPALSTEGEIVNVDGDRAAAAVASAVGARTLVLLTGAVGLLRDAEDPTSRIPRLARTDLDTAIHDWARGRMKIKLRAAAEALDGGVAQVIIAPSAVDQPLQRALNGEGTVIS